MIPGTRWHGIGVIIILAYELCSIGPSTTKNFLRVMLRLSKKIKWQSRSSETDVFRNLDFFESLLNRYRDECSCVAKRSNDERARSEPGFSVAAN